MADISLGIYSVTQLSVVPQYGPPGQQRESYNATLTGPQAQGGGQQGGLVPQMTMMNLTPGATPLAFEQVTLGKQYEVIFREVALAP